ncbi:DUF3943 domain-containing protein [Photobacterium alginatilyticum]|uniref:DUF3943 domain-containing protein n=1 Tax=Photobacterium alginatilyticum TaxID=1775171 RepID=A0ABW9YE52_9GAMM|nr:DUF3943 domain-containing protein [Photobacterium alginatilyticum]NBI51715.1 DUF3943 domain-containing protein [Photobacterium alginatilyticum]
MQCQFTTPLLLASFFVASPAFGDEYDTLYSTSPSVLASAPSSLPGYSNTTWEDQPRPDSVYDSPYSVALFSAENGEDADRLWSQTKSVAWYGVGVAGFIALLPEDISNWDNSSERLMEKWWKNVKDGPVWDRDIWYINYIGHPYFGGVYYQVARKSGYRQWDAFVYSFLMSTFYWEYGLEAFAEVPAIQDLVVTPVLGWVYGEWAFNKEREIIQGGGEVWGSSLVGDMALFFLDPVDSIGCGINNLVGRDVIKAGTGYIGFQDVSLSNGEVDTQFRINMSYSIGEGETSPALKRRREYATSSVSNDPIDDGVVGISIGARYLDLDSDWQLENRWAPTISLGVYFTPAFSSRLNYTRVETPSTITKADVSYENYSFDFQYYFNNKDKLRPYLNVGIGETLLEKSVDLKTFQINGGAGLHYQFHANWALLADWSHYHSTSTSTNDDLFSGQLVYRFGRGER